MVYGDGRKEGHVGLEDLDGEARHDSRGDDDFPEDSVEAFVEVCAASSEFKGFDNCMFDVNGKAVVSVMCPCSRRCREDVFGSRILRPFVELSRSTRCPYSVDGAGDKKDSVVRQFVRLPFGFVEEYRSRGEERKRPDSRSLDDDEELGEPGR